MASTSSSGALLASSQSPFVMCTLLQMLFKESSVSCAVAIVHVAWPGGRYIANLIMSATAVRPPDVILTQRQMRTFVLRLPVHKICAEHVRSRVKVK